MKDIFPGYYKKTEAELKGMWEKGILVFDANVLLNLYRYSDSTCETLLEVISKFGEQIYLPHQAALEYNRNRYEVIAEQEKAYREFRDKISQIQKDLQSVNKPPFLSQAVDKDLNGIFERVNKEVQESIEKYNSYLKEDPIYNRLSTLFDKRITNPFNEEEIKQIYKEGEERYKLKIPPGFEDEKTKEGNKKFGDLVLWKQIITTARELKKDVILVTDERKVDWWWIIKDGRNMGPRQELIEEIKKSAGVNFHMYSSERFLSYGQTILNEKINQQALKEIEAMKKAELEELYKLQLLKKLNSEREHRATEELIAIRNRIEDINNKLSNLRKHTDKLRNDSLYDNETQEYLHSMSIHEAELEAQREELIEQLNTVRLYNQTTDESINKLRVRWKKYFMDENDSETQEQRLT